MIICSLQFSFEIVQVSFHMADPSCSIAMGTHQ